MTILKDSNYWKEYNQKRRAYLTLKERRQKIKGVYNQETKLERVQPESVVDKPKEIKVVDNLKKEKVVDLESYNAEVYKRAGTKDPKRFFTFPDEGMSK